MTRDSNERIGGFAGLGFLVLVIAENILRGAPIPHDADVLTILNYYATRRGALAVTQGLFILTLPLLLTYATAMSRRLSAAGAEMLATIGRHAAGLVIVTFAAVVVFDIVLSTLTESASDAPAVVLALFRLHSAAFVINSAMLGTALGAFGLAAWQAGTEPRWLAGIGILAAMLLMASAVPVQAVLGGSPWGILGLAGFLGWLVWLGATSTRMIRGT